MELCEPEPIGLLHDHDRRVRDVDADLDHRRRHQNVELAGFELCHDRPPVGRLEATVEAPDPEAAQLGPPQPLGLVLGGTRDGRLRGFDQRADDIRLTAVCKMAAQPLVRLRAAIVGHPRRHDRLAIPGGAWISETERSPYTVSASVRGIGVAVMWRT